MDLRILTSIYIAGFGRLYDFLLLNLKAFHQPAKLLTCDRHELFFATHPPELAVIRPFVEEKETIAFPKKCFYPIALSAAEDEKSRFEGIHFKSALDQSRKTIDRLTHIGVSACNVYLLGNGYIA